MRNSLKNRTISGRAGTSTLLALTLSASLAAFGCTTNQNVGNGEPATGAPAGRTAPTAGTNGGSSSGSSVPQPMTSSSRLSADDAAAIMAQHEPARGVVLGVTAQPDTGEARAVTNGATAVFDGTINQATINSTVGDPNPGAAMVSGAGDEAVILDAEGVVAPATVVTNVAGTTGVTTGNVVSSPITTTSATLPVSPGAFAAGAPSTGTLAIGTTQGSSLVTPVTAATSPVIATGTTVTNSGSTIITTNGVGTATSTRATGANALRTGTATARTTAASSSVRVVRNADGTVTVTNQK